MQRSNTQSKRRRIPLPRSRRGVVAVLAMMFLVLFGSLSVAMAVVTQGNLRTAASHIRVVSSLGAVDTGIEIASARLQEAASRFVVAKGQIDPDYAEDLWDGTFGASPAVTILPAPFGRAGEVNVNSLRTAIIDAHLAHDANDLITDDSNVPLAINIPDAPDGWIVTDPIGVERAPNGLIVTATQISYIPPDDEGRILVVVTGYNWDTVRAQWVTRTAQQYFDITKPVKQAIVAPTRIMLGQNVQVNGPLGAAFDNDDLDSLDGPPLVMRSDFYGLDAELDDRLDDFFDAVLADDQDGDNRLRDNKFGERDALAELNLIDYDGDLAPDLAFTDATRDHAVDDFDIFLNFYDSNGDGKVVLSGRMTAGTPNDGLAAEFDINDALAMLIDSAVADRNGNGRYNGRLVDGWWLFDEFPDNNHDGVINNDDIDADDINLGYRDGVLDYKDRYAKVRGSVYFRASRSQWEAADDGSGNSVDDYQQFVQGAIRPDAGDLPVIFETTENEVPTITAASFSEATEALIDAADGDTVLEQARDQNGPTWTPPSFVESTPFGSPTPADWYDRPVYEGITFRNAVIPMGTNALFIDCTFVGVTRVEAYIDNTHESWIFYGQQERDQLTGQLNWLYPPPPDYSSAQLDTSYLEEGVEDEDGILPEPLMVSVDLNGDGITPDQCTNTKLLANNLRFHDCLFVGSIVADQPTVFSPIRNKLQFTGATRFTSVHPDAPDDPELNPDSDDMDEIAKSSMMLPNYSVDIGTNNSPQAQDVNLNGAVIAGVLDVRGNARINGVLLLTYDPVYGSAPLELYGEAVGNPGSFNVTLGYFGPEDGDLEGIDLTALADLDGDGNDDIGWDSARDENGALIPIASAGPTQDWWFDGVPDEDSEISPGTYVRRAISFEGLGEIQLNYDPDIILPDGLAMRLAINPIRSSYIEGRVVIDQQEQ
ncbi:MAG: hypothetical protein R3B46_07905 [Phycisphaerales bacterium]